MRAALLLALGSRCAKCGTDQELELDCVVPTGDKHHRAGVYTRHHFYKKQHAAGNLQILCERCHVAKSVMEHPQQQTKEQTQ